MHPQLTLKMHFILYLNFSYFINRRNYLDSVPVRPLHLLIDIAVCPLRLAYMKPPVLQFNNIYNLNPTRYRYHPIMKVLSSVILYNLSAAAVSSDDIPTSYLIILSITGGASYKTDIPYPCFFTHVRELWLSVVSIFNTSVDVESF